MMYFICTPDGRIYIFKTIYESDPPLLGPSFLFLLNLEVKPTSTPFSGKRAGNRKRGLDTRQWPTILITVYL